MVKIQTEFSKLWFTILFCVFLITCCNAEFESQAFLDVVRFERMKNDLFRRSNETRSYYANSTDDWKCLQELNTIGIGLAKYELWAETIVDAWGKLPPGIMDGNIHDFGSLSECFHIDRNGELYKTEYCMGQVELHSNGISKWKYSKYDFIPQPDNGTALTFGICLPVGCSAEFLQKYFVEQTNNLGIQMPIRLLKNSCQIEEYPSKFTTLDWIAAAFLITILTVILTSTSYDIHCSIKKYPKVEGWLAFSFYSNGKELLSCESAKSKDVIRCLDGIRALSAAWIVLAHTTETFFRLPIRNKAYIETYHSHYINMTVLSAMLAADTFLVISGLLVTINMLKHFEKTGGKINVPMLFFHRYLRLTPLFAVIILIIMSLYRFIGSGPFWPNVFNDLREPCAKKWWLALLYVQNYFNAEDYPCHPASWYLSVDMQLYIIAPLIIYLIYRFHKKTIAALLILVLGCIGFTVDVHLKHGYKLGLIQTPDELAYGYIPTHIRCSPWLIGVIAGYIFHETRNKKIRFPPMINAIGWMLSMAVVNAVIFGYYPLVQLNSTSTRLEYGLYFAMSRVSWSIALCYIIFACHHNYGGLVNWFLGHRLWQPLSRLSYSTYLINYLVIYAIMGTTTNSSYFTERTCFLAAVEVFILTVFVSMIATLAFEMPISIIDKLMFCPKDKRYDNNNRNDVEKSTQH